MSRSDYVLYPLSPYTSAGDPLVMDAPQSLDPVGKRVAVLGGGISGLAAAHRLREIAPWLEVVLLEAGGHLGGVLQTVKQDGFLVEWGADNFITNVPWAIDLCRRIGYEDQLVKTSPHSRKAFVVHKGRLCNIPEGFLIMAPNRVWPVLTTPILTWPGKLRLACERFVRPRTETSDESVAHFAIRRLGREVFERLVQPLVGGIYTADPYQLSLAATLPRFIEMEREHGSLIRAAKRQASARPESTRGGSGARYSLFTAPREGMSHLVDALVARLPHDSIRLNAPVQAIERQTDGGWSLSIGAEAPQRMNVDALIVTAPANRSGSLVENVDPSLAGLMGQIPYASSAIVSLGFRRTQIKHPLDGSGFVVPLTEGRRILSGSFASVKYPDRAPAGHELVRVFVGGACQPEMAELPDEALRSVVLDELDELLGLDGEPVFEHIVRCRSQMPQYHLGHCELVQQIEAGVGEIDRFELAGNAYHGVGMPHCIRSGEQAAERIAAIWETVSGASSSSCTETPYPESHVGKS